MPSFDIAHIREQGVALIIIPLSDSFDSKTSRDQAEIVDTLQSYASSAGLEGTVVPVWNSGSRLRFIAPRNWHPFFRSISWSFIARNINRRLSCA